jgi:hypothetical protein
MLLKGQPAYALPGFASQTGLPCTQCHVLAFGPALTAYGRQFKLNGYTFGQGPQPMPLALMALAGYTRTNADQPEAPAPGYTENDNVSLDQVSLFYGGRISSHIGAFAQVTWDGIASHTAWDNLDVRYARSVNIGSHAVVLGVSLNNSPSVQDLWNSTPSWGFPYVSSALAPTPAAGTLLDGTLAGVSLGATAYAMLDDHLYLEFGGYKGLTNRGLRAVGLGDGDNVNLDGLAPYARAALQFNQDQQSWSAGVLALQGRLRPDPTQPETDNYRDLGFDATYQWVAAPSHGLLANAAYVHESRSLNQSAASGAAAFASGHLDTFNLNATYVYRQTWAVTAAWFDIKGSVDDSLYAPGPVSGSASGSPDSAGYVVGVEWIPFGKMDSFARPWLNVRTGVQYTLYQRFNGGGSNYDGFGRSASQNDTLYTYLWLLL